jgi:hypothetical protein
LPTAAPVDVVKKEPEWTLSNSVDPAESCVAAATGGACNGRLHNLNKLTSYLNTLTGLPVSTDDGSSAMERAIIKSRMRIPFWKADEVNQRLKRVLDRGPKQRESKVTVLCPLSIIILIS